MAMILAGCGFHVDKGNVPAKLDQLEKKFGVQWPTNYTKEYGGSLTGDRGPSDIVVRLEVTDSMFSLWQQAATNKLREHQYGAPKDPKIEKYFSWWDCSMFPSTQVFAFANDSNDTNGHLFVWVVETNKMHTMYIHGLPMGN